MTAAYVQPWAIFTERTSVKTAPTAGLHHTVEGRGHGYDGSVYLPVTALITLGAPITGLGALELGRATFNSGDPYELVIEDATDATPGLVAIEDLAVRLLSSEDPISGQSRVILDASNAAGDHLHVEITPPSVSAPPPDLFESGATYRAVIRE